jgi:hypothetical protein
MRIKTFLEVMTYELEGKALVEYKQTNLVGKDQATFGGEFDTDTGDILLYLLASSLEGKLTKTQTRELEYEAYKTIYHEQVHRDQHKRNMTIEHPVKVSRADYLLHPCEVEAYARVDIGNDLKRYGFSLDLLEYAKLLTEDIMETEKGMTAYSILHYYQLPIDEYLDKLYEENKANEQSH